MGRLAAARSCGPTSAPTVTGFTGATEIDLPVACTYDFEVAAAKYFHSLDGGEIPIVLLFSGTVFASERRRPQRVAGRVERGGVVPAAGVACGAT